LLNGDEVKGALPDDGSAGTLNGYAIWAELSDEEIAELESAILDRSESRPG
jgi:hypothetical protein